jgi:Tubulin/FtsZ family, GTPase domain
MFRLASATRIASSRRLFCSSRSLLRDTSSSTSSPSLNEKALKAMLNSANPTNLNGEESVSKRIAPSKPPAFVLEPTKSLDATATTTTSDIDDTKENLGEPSPKLQTSKEETKTMPQPIVLSPQPQQSLPPRPPNHRSFSAPALHEFSPKILVIGVGGAGNNAINNMIAKELHGVDFLALNTDAQHLSTSLTDQRLQMGVELTRGLGAGANPDAGRM